MGSVELAAIVGITMGLIEVLKKMIEHFGDKKQYRKSILSQEEREWLHDLHKMHSRYDEDGVPLWYVPRSWATVQKEIVSVLREITQDQKKIAEVLERIEKNSEKMSEKLAKTVAS